MLATSAWFMFWVWMLGQPDAIEASNSQIVLMWIYSIIGSVLALQWDMRQQ